jgi:tripartite-type tricarboxylate transporter receptor subunit TctC
VALIKLAPCLPIRLVAALALAAAATCAWAQSGYPRRPVRIIVPWPAGGSVDVATRIVAERLSSGLAQPFIVDNRPGAAGNIGAAAGAKAAPDGYTLLVATTPMLINRSLSASLPFDTIKDFAPVSLLVNLHYVLTVNPAVADSVKALVALAKARPGRIGYASSGTGTQLHLIGETFRQKAGIDIVHVPYKGAPPALADMVGGHIQMMFPGLPVAYPLIKAGQLKALAAVSKERLALLPDVPTMAQAGYPGIETVEWYGVVAPNGTPKDIVARLNQEIVKVLGVPAVHQVLADRGFEPAGSTPAQFASLIGSDQDKWTALVRQINLHMN